MRRVRFFVVGLVQGVGFRAATEREAQRLELTGFVRNRRDGAVEGEAQGDDESVLAFAAWLRQGPPWSRVDQLELVDLPAIGGERGFDLRR
jgi:acylphosphatase